MPRTTFLICLSLLLVYFLVGCSDGGGAPTSPAINNDLTTSRLSLGGGTSHVLWAYYNVGVNTSTGGVEITPLRTAGFNVNVTRFMQPPISPTHLINITFDTGASDLSNGLAVLDFSVTHPFPGLARFRGFDVRGIFLADGTSTLPGDMNLVYAGENETMLLNADGYTRWWNPTEFTSETIFGYEPGSLGFPINPTAILNPYKYFCDDLDTESPLSDVTLENRGTFSVEKGTNTRRYEIQFKMDGDDVIFGFNYAIDASWEGLPSGSEYEVDDFPLSANMNEAWFVELDTSSSTLEWFPDSTAGGDLVASVTVHDWQSLESGGSVQNEVNEINLHSTLFPTGLTEILSGGATLISEDTGEATWELSVASAELDFHETGDFDIWVEVLSSDPDTYTPQIPGGDSFPVSDGLLAAYLWGSVTISEGIVLDPPVVTSVDPGWGYLETSYEGVSIEGENFTNDGLDVVFETETYELPISNITFVSDTEITVDIDCSGAELDFYDVTVTVNDPLSPGTLEGILEDGYRVGESWPQFGKNKFRNCLSNATGPQSASDIVYTTSCTIATAPETLLIGPDPDNAGERLVYLGYYYAVNVQFSAYYASTGVEKWAVPAPSPYSIYRLLAVAPPGVPCPNDEIGTVYVWAYTPEHAAPEKVMALSAVDGAILWEWTAPNDGSWLCLERFGMVLDNGDFLLCHNSHSTGEYFLTCLDVADGSENWQVDTGTHQTPDLALSPDGSTLYVDSCSPYGILAYTITDIDATLKWTYNGEWMGTHQSGLIVLRDGTLVCAGKHYDDPVLTRVQAVQDNGSSATMLWETGDITGTGVPWSQIAEGPDSSIYFAAGAVTTAWGPCTLYRLDPADGSILNQSSAKSGLEPRSGLAVDHEGNIYAGADGHIFAFNQDCSDKWEIAGGRFTDAALDVDGSLFAADITNGQLYRIQTTD